MFSINEKRGIASAVAAVLRATNHPELPKEGEPIEFTLSVKGSQYWSYAIIKNNESINNPSLNPWNESQGRDT